MKFRENLLHLRQQRNMTQEQLAMLLGVSRQSVAKWEAGRSTPEVDKLVRMADLFGCSLDELVSDDLSTREVAPEEVLEEGDPAKDVCGYDDHIRSFSFRLATGAALGIVGVAGAAFSDTLNLGDAAAATSMFAGTLAALAFILPAGIEHGAFTQAHPFVEDFYTNEQKASIRRQFTYSLVLGIGTLLIGGALAVIVDEAGYDSGIAGGAVSLLSAVGAWLIICNGIRYGFMNVENYNKSRDDDRRSRENPRKGYVCGIIMLIATIVALLLLFGAIAGLLPMVLIAFFWVPWPIGGIACGIAVLAMKYGEVPSR